LIPLLLAAAVAAAVVALVFVLTGDSGLRARVVVSAANVRSGPGTSYGVVGSLPSGSNVRVSCEVDAGAGPWAKLSSPYGGNYVASGLLSISGDPKSC
jgi:uncharacterized protein YraI